MIHYTPISNLIISPTLCPDLRPFFESGNIRVDLVAGLCVTTERYLQPQGEFRAMLQVGEDCTHHMAALPGMNPNHQCLVHFRRFVQ